MVDAVVSFVVQKLGDSLIQEADLLLGVKDDVNWLKNELGWMQAFLKDAEKKQADNEKVCKWVSEIRDIAYDTEDVLDTFILKERGNESSKFCIPSCLSKQSNFYTIAKEIGRLKSRLLDISRKRDIYGIREIGGSGYDGETSNVIRKLRELRRSSSYADQEKVVGFEVDSSLLAAELVKEEPQRCVMSILGMGGLGKTTMARKLYNCNLVVHNFPSRAWVCVSQEYEPKDVLRQAIISFTHCGKEEAEKMEKLNLEDLERHLREYLTGRQYLVVIDDVWQRETWESLKRAFPDNENGSRVIITTRIKAVAERSDDRTYVHQLRFLNADESWELFQKKASCIDINYNSDMKVLGQEMVEKCHGLPLAIIVLGGLLSTKKSSHEWKIVRDHLWKHLRNDSIQIAQILSLSFYALPKELKPCFLFLGMYPEDFIIGVDILIRLWVSEGFIQEEEEETMEKVAEYYLNDLIDRSLLQIHTIDSNRVVACRIHDLLRDLAIQKAKEIKFLSIYDGKTRGASSAVSLYECRRLAIHGFNMKPELLKNLNSSLRTLMLFGRETDYEFIRVVCSKFKLLRVLDVRSGPYGDPSGKWILPSELRRLAHLRYLRFGGTLLRELPAFLPHLQNLQTLMLRGEFYLYFSENEINMLHKIKRLRHLYIIGKKFCISDFADIQTYGFEHHEIWQSFYLRN